MGARRRPSAVLVVLSLVALGVVAAGCAKVANTSGWARPEVANQLMYLTLDKGKLTAVDPANGFNKKWTFPATEEFSCGGGESKKYTLEGIYGEPSSDADNVYFATYDG